MSAPLGNLQGLKPGQIRALERLYKRRYPNNAVWLPEHARELALLSRSISRQIGLLIDRSGKVRMVIVGDASSLYIPELPRLSRSGKVLRGWRLAHTHLGPDCLSREDLLDMLFLRLDAIILLNVNEMGEPLVWQAAWLNSEASHKGQAEPWIVKTPAPWNDCAWAFAELMQTLENGFDRKTSSGLNPDSSDNAILISVSAEPVSMQEKHLDELAELAKSAGIIPANRLIQRINRQNAKLLPGKGKLAELEIMALDAGADLLLFDGELSPAQLNALADGTQRKVMDRTQLILDIFARHASSKAGRLQVELAQLAYMQPRLAGSGSALDRLAGGPGGRGPGESRLETDRRKIRERMAFLRKQLARISKQRQLVRNRRARNGIPQVALVGYTNAGKSSLLNKITASSVTEADQLFATLDSAVRRIRFPSEKEMLLADTVGFIRNLPRELMEAFRATLEELDNAELLLHVVDCSNPDFERQMDAVNNTLEDLGYARKPVLLLFNKADKLSDEERSLLAQAWPQAIFVSAASGFGLQKLLAELTRHVSP